MTSEETLKLQIAIAVAADAFAARRRREEREYRDMQCWGPLLTKGQYAMMNRRVDCIMISTPESAASAAAATAWNKHVIAKTDAEQVLKMTPFSYCYSQPQKKRETQ